MCVTDCHDMTLAVEMALNPSTTKVTTNRMSITNWYLLFLTNWVPSSQIKINLNGRTLKITPLHWAYLG